MLTPQFSCIFPGEGVGNTLVPWQDIGPESSRDPLRISTWLRSCIIQRSALSKLKNLSWCRTFAVIIWVTRRGITRRTMAEEKTTGRPARLAYKCIKGQKQRPAIMDSKHLYILSSSSAQGSILIYSGKLSFIFSDHRLRCYHLRLHNSIKKI